MGRESLTEHGIEMSYTMCKSKQHTKRKCPNKDKVVEPTPIRPRGRPIKDGHHLHQVKLAFHQPTLVLQPCLLEQEEVVGS